MPAQQAQEREPILNGAEKEVKFSETLSLADLKFVAEQYATLVHDHAYLVHFKEVATKYLTEEQLEEIEEEMNDLPEINY